MSQANPSIRESLDSDSRARVAKNTAVLVMLRFLMPVVSLAIVLAISRLLGVDGLGRYTLAFTLVSICSTLTPLGLYAVVTRDGARERDRLGSLLGNAMLIGAVASLTVTAVVLIAGNRLGYDEATQSALALLSLTILPATLVSLAEGAFTAIERMDYIAVSAIADNLVKVGIGALLLFLGYGLNAVMLAAVGGRLLACISSLWLLRRAGVRTRWAPEASVLKTLLRAAPTFTMIQVFSILYWRIDVFMLSQLRPVDDVGYYGAAFRLLEFAMVLPQSFCLALYPQMAYAERTQPAALASLGDAALRYLGAVTLPAAVCTSVLAGPILVLLYGESFRVAGHTLGVLIWTVVPYSWVRYYAYVLVAAERQRIDLTLNAIMSTANIMLNFVLIPAYGYLGAAVATFISICLYAVGQYAYVRRHLPHYVSIGLLHPTPVAAAAFTGLVLWWFSGRSLALTLPLAPALYFGILVTAGFFTANELRLLRLDRALAGVKPFARKAG